MADKVTFPIIETIFLRIISRFTPEQLKEAIDKDMDLAKLSKQYIPDIIEWGRSVAGPFVSNSYLLTTDAFLEWFQREEPTLYNEIVANPAGERWIEKNLRGILALFTGGS